MNNVGIRRHGKPPKNCRLCGKPAASNRHVYCSKECSSLSRRKSADDIRRNNAFRQSRYRSKKYRVLAPDANIDLIKQIYLNCPKGYEVDHIIPLSKGGLHHENNLQYLLKEVNRRKGNRMVRREGLEPPINPL